MNAAQLNIVHYPASVLRTKATPVPEITDEIRAIAARMIQVMRQEEGIGLAAPQVGVSLRIFVVDIPPPKDGPENPPSTPGGPATHTNGPEVYVNPVLSSPTGAPEPLEEGCLSLPEIRGEVLRPPTVTLTYMDLDGRKHTRVGAGLLARCWQHELDHLDGVLIIDRMTQKSRLKNRAAVRELERSG